VSGVDKTSIGYWASQEQYSMQQLIEFVKEAEKGGTISIPGGYGNFTWVWLDPEIAWNEASGQQDCLL
jgi:hypothetical protein